jgi:glycosyl transferase family 87
VTLTPRESRVLIAVGVLYAAVVIPIGIHKGGDFTYELGQSERLLHAVPLYDVGPEKGAWWPPFTALGLVPFALIARWSLAVSKACWAVLNVFSLGWSLALARRWTIGWAPIVLAVAAVGKPLQSNFEHLNLTPILLALIVAAAADLEDRRDARAGAWIGLAGAIKGFPALLLLYFAYRRRWKSVAIGLATAGALTVIAMLPLGPAGAVDAVLDWLRLSSQGAAIGRLGTQSLPGFSFFFGWSQAAVAVLALACAGAALLAFRTSPAGPLSVPDGPHPLTPSPFGRGGTHDIPTTSPLSGTERGSGGEDHEVERGSGGEDHEVERGSGGEVQGRGGEVYNMGLMTLVAVLCSPIAWLYYYTLAFPAWVAVLRGPPPSTLWIRVPLVAAGLLTSGVLTFDLYPPFLWFIRDANYTWGGLVLLAALVAHGATHPEPAPQPT